MGRCREGLAARYVRDLADRSGGLAELGGKALWTKELDRCLVEGRTDLSVHSMKDVETIRPAALVIAAWAVLFVYQRRSDAAAAPSARR